MIKLSVAWRPKEPPGPLFVKASHRATRFDYIYIPHLCIYRPIYLYIYIYIYLYLYLYIYIFMFGLSTCPLVRVSVYVPVCPPIDLHVHVHETKLLVELLQTLRLFLNVLRFDPTLSARALDLLLSSPAQTGMATVTAMATPGTTIAAQVRRA